MRRSKKEGRRPPFSVGGISILMVFVMLCLTTFGVLTLVTALAEKRLAEKNAASVESYYQSKTEAEKILARIDSVVSECVAQGKSSDEMKGEIEAIGGVSVAVDGAEMTVDISTAGDGALGFAMALLIDPTGGITVTDSHMTSETDFTYNNITEDLWPG